MIPKALRGNLAAGDLSLACASRRLRTIRTRILATATWLQTSLFGLYPSRKISPNTSIKAKNGSRPITSYRPTPPLSLLRLSTDTKLVGVTFAPDPVLGGIDTPNGRVGFLQMVGPHAARARLATRGSERRTSRVFDKHDARGQSFANNRPKAHERIRLI